MFGVGRGVAGEALPVRGAVRACDEERAATEPDRPRAPHPDRRVERYDGSVTNG